MLSWDLPGNKGKVKTLKGSFVLPAQNGEQRLAKDSALLLMADFPTGLHYFLNDFLVFY